MRVKGIYDNGIIKLMEEVKLKVPLIEVEVSIPDEFIILGEGERFLKEIEKLRGDVTVPGDIDYKEEWHKHLERRYET